MRSKKTYAEMKEHPDEIARKELLVKIARFFKERGNTSPLALEIIREYLPNETIQTTPAQDAPQIERKGP
jgi:hypothetical protein